MCAEKFKWKICLIFSPVEIFTQPTFDFLENLFVKKHPKQEVDVTFVIGKYMILYSRL
jgi:hypothetical protein